eukprot:scaffold4278_cov173-Amphora_coffeaeformis.AAC.4
MSTYSSDFISTYDLQQKSGSRFNASDIGLKKNGYAFLASSEEQKKILLENHYTQRSCGVDWIHVGGPAELSARYPWLNTDDLVYGSFSGEDTNTKEGYFDPWGFMQCMKHEALDHGVVFLEGQVDQVKCVDESSSPRISEPLLRIESIHLRHGKHDSSDVEEVNGIETMINCTGSWTRSFINETICKTNESILSPVHRASILHLLPIERRKRCIFFIHCPGKHEFTHPVPPTNTPLTIDPTGVYFRSEGTAPGHFLCGVSPEPHLDGDYDNDEDLENVDHHLFEDTIWPILAHRVPAFNELKARSSWSGFYDYNTFDQNAIIGNHPYFSNLLCAGGFSGHGLQMAPAAGRAVAELLLHGNFRTLDLSNFSFERLVNQTPYLETGIV